MIRRLYISNINLNGVRSIANKGQKQLTPCENQIIFIHKTLNYIISYQMTSNLYIM